MSARVSNSLVTDTLSQCLSVDIFSYALIAEVQKLCEVDYSDIVPLSSN